MTSVALPTSEDAVLDLEHTALSVSSAYGEQLGVLLVF